MKKLKYIGTLLLSINFLFANPAFMGGITLKFGKDYNINMENTGATFKVLSTDEDKKPVLTAGVSYYPWVKNGKKYGVDVGAGYNINSTTVSGSWDFVQNQPSVSIGYSTGFSGSYEEFVEDPNKELNSCSQTE